jgi:hypothetical protein
LGATSIRCLAEENSSLFCCSTVNALPENCRKILAMKKAILSTLYSGLVIPGLGQVINKQLKKGICILILVFFLFVGTLIKLYLIISNVFETKSGASDTVAVMEKLAAQNLSLLWYLLTAFAILWFYSVLDAYMTGKKLDRLGERDRL